MNAWKANGNFDEFIKMKHDASMAMPISYFMTMFEHRKPQDTSKPLADANNFQEVFQACRSFYKPGSCGLFQSQVAHSRPPECDIFCVAPKF
jgi:hypothetical protein